MFRCKECGEIGKRASLHTTGSIVHKPDCSMRSDNLENFDPADHEERRAIAAEKSADALMHLATAHVDGARAFIALCDALTPVIADIKELLEEARAEAEAEREKRRT